ncbi:MAG: hypothetical protein LBJ18_03425 [Rickettsiales bacterium]|jgi:phosphoribosylformylglycinamidine cyclo-ligase|nr:hypothetical protein [Rickettsiales bacterium]
MSSSNYQDLGVSSKKEAVHNAVKNNSKGLYPYSFCKIEPCASNAPKIISAIQKIFNLDMVDTIHADGAGTKTALAYIYWKETGDMSVWRNVVQDSIVMNLDDVACIGAMSGNMRLASNIDRNTFNIPAEVIAELINGENLFLAKMREYGITNITGQSGETADVPDLTGTVVVNNTLYAKMRRKDVIDNGRIDAGDYIIGLASDGIAAYENEYNGGMGSNGLTLGRHGVFSKEYAEKYPESYDHHHLEAGTKAYRGTKKLDDLIDVKPGLKIPAGKLVLSPTRTYAPIIKAMGKAGIGAGKINGMVHCSGGGQTKVLNYLSKPLLIDKTDMFRVPALFNMIQAESDTDWKEMYQDFNMGHRMEIYVPGCKTAADIIKISEAFGVPAHIVGRVAKGISGNSMVRINSQHGVFSYSR